LTENADADAKPSAAVASNRTKRHKASMPGSRWVAYYIMRAEQKATDCVTNYSQSNGTNAAAASAAKQVY